MALPTPRLPLALVLHLLLAMDAGAQASEDPNERRILLSEHTAEAPPEIRVRPGAATLVRFVDASIAPESIELDGSRVNLFDKGTRTLVIEPLMALGPTERVGLSVHFADTQSPARTSFILVSAPDAVDGRVAVMRRGLSIEALSAALGEARAELVAKEAELQSLRVRAAATGPAGLALQGLIDTEGVDAKSAVCLAAVADDVECTDATGFRARSWALVVVEVRNNGREPWAPADARLTHAVSGKSVKGVSVRMIAPQIGPGEHALVAVEVSSPPWSKGEKFHLDLRDTSGARRLLVPSVKL